MARRRAGAGLALAAVALTAAGCSIGGSTTTVTSTVTRTVTTTKTVTTSTTTSNAADCTGSQLSGTFDVVTGSGSAGQIEYTLTLDNTSQASCSMPSPPKAVLLSASGSSLPTHITPVYGSGPTVVIRASGSAKALVRFSPDVPGTGDNQSGACQPRAHTLAVTPPGGGTVDAPITPPTSVCEQGTLDFEPFSAG